MACRMTHSDEGWINPPLDPKNPFGVLREEGSDRLRHEALRQTVRQMASSPLQEGHIFCFLKSPLGGEPIAFAT